MTGVKTQAVLGVSTDENIITTVWPSVACTGIGKLLGTIYDVIPLRINGVKISHLLFVLPTAPIGVLIYLGLKVVGVKYVLTNRSISKWSALGGQKSQEVPLERIADVVIRQKGGQAFFRAADITLLDATEAPLMKLEGIAYPEGLRHNILEARDASLLVTSSLNAISARG